VTVVATICADGTSLSPGLIYEGQPNTIRDTWLEGVNKEEHLAFLTSSENGWTNDELGFDWLVNLFDRETRAKAKRNWRLLFLDGHGSHLTMRFLDWCQSNKILVAVYPPHSTHRQSARGTDESRYPTNHELRTLITHPRAHGRPPLHLLEIGQ